MDKCVRSRSDAEDAVKARDGYDYDGYRLRVEFPRGGGPGSYRGNRGDRNRGERSNRGPVTKRSQYRVLVTGLPPSGSWQDLKDHMREAGDVCFADTYKDGTGVVEFLRLDDMKYAIKKLDDSRFRSHEVSAWNWRYSYSFNLFWLVFSQGEVSYVRVREDTGDDRSRSRSRSSLSPRRRRGTPTYSPVRRSYSRSRSDSRSNY